MTFLIIIGWFMITLGAGGSLFASGVILSATLGFTGKAGFEWIFPFVIACLLFWASYSFFPFHVSMVN